MKSLIGVLVASAALAVVVISAMSPTSDGDRPARGEQNLDLVGNFTLPQARRFKRFPLYYFGRSFREFPLVGIYAGSSGAIRASRCAWTM